MKKQLSVLALLALPACFGGGGGSGGGGVDVTPSGPSVSMNNDFSTLLNGVRMGANEDPVVYNSSLGRAAQIHANDMVDRDYLDVLIPGAVNANGDPKDIGDLITEQGYTWSVLLQLVEQGDLTLDDALSEFDNTGNCGGGGQDPCLTDDRLEVFGIAKAGAGTDQKWVLVLAAP